MHWFSRIYTAEMFQPVWFDSNASHPSTLQSIHRLCIIWPQHVSEHPITELQHLSVCKHSSVTSRLPRRLCEATRTKVRRGSAPNPQLLQAPAEQIKAWHWFEITSLCVTCKTKQAGSHKPANEALQKQPIQAVLGTGVLSGKSS